MSKENKEDLIQRRKAGRPRVYDPDVIEQEMLEWVKDENAINFAQFCADRGYHAGLIWRLEQLDVDFANTYEIVKMKLAERRERMLNADLLNSGAYHRYQSGYDPFLNHFEDHTKDKEATRKRGIVETERKNFVELTRMIAKGEVSQQDIVQQD